MNDLVAEAPGLREVGIFRLQLFKPSETFIAAQAGAMHGFKPFYIGRGRFGPAAPGQAIALQDTAPKYAAPIVWNALSRNPAAFMRILGAKKPALIHAHFGPDAVFALPLARRLGIPLVTTFHGFDATLSIPSLLRSRSPYLLNYLLYRKQLANQGAFFICVSDHIREKVIALGFPPARTKTYYIGVDVQQVLPAEHNPKDTTILHVARLVEKKGTEYLIRAFERIAHLYTDWRLTIIGDGPLRGRLQNIVHELGLAGRVDFLGAQPHKVVLSTMMRAGVLAVPSVTAPSGDTEGLPVTLLEAFASGLPVIATQHGGIPEAVTHGQTGFLVPERDVAALAIALQELLANPSRRLAMGKIARAHVESRFNLHLQTALLEQVYEEVLA